MDLDRAAWILLFCLLAGCGDEPTTAATTPTPAAAEPGPVVFIGDSLTAGWVLPTDIVNAGASGQVSGQMLDRFDRVLALKPSIVHILAGTNDVRSFSDPTIYSIARMAELASQAGACVIIGTVPPNVVWGVASDVGQTEGDINIARFNEELFALAGAYGYLIADYHSVLILPDGSQDSASFYDGIHVNSTGQLKMWEVVEPLIEQCQGS